MSLPKQMKDMMYRLLQEPTLDKFREFLQAQTGEHNSIDFKRQWLPAAQLAKVMLAIANSQGGIIIFGISENEDKSVCIEGLTEFKDKADVSNEIKKYLSTNLKYDVFNYSYDTSEYEALAGKRFQMLYIEDAPEFIPFMSNRDSENIIKSNVIYVRRGTSCEAANQEEIQNLISRRINHTHPQTGKALKLDEHLKQLRILYDSIHKKKVTDLPNWAKILTMSTMSIKEMYTEMTAENEQLSSPNPFYPDEEYDEFIARMITAKKNKIERYLDLY